MRGFSPSITAPGSQGVANATVGGVLLNANGTAQSGTKRRLSYAAIVLADKPTGYWPLNETSGTTAFDATSSGNNGTYSGTFTLNQPGPFPGSASVFFDGIAGQMAVPAASGGALDLIKGFTIETWFMPIATPKPGTSYMIVGRQGLDSLILDTIAINYAFGRQGFGSLLSSLVPAPGVWVHLVGVYKSAGNDSIYLNGTQIATGTSLTNAGTTSNVWLVAGTAGPPIALKCNQAQVALYSTALTATQILNHYNAGKGLFQAISDDGRYEQPSDSGTGNIWRGHRIESGIANIDAQVTDPIVQIGLG